MDPFKLQGDPDPAKCITKCPTCNAEIGQQKGGTYVCPKHGVVTPIIGDAYQRKTPQPGERADDFGPRHTLVGPSSRVAQSMDKVKKNKKEPDHPKHDKSTVRTDVFRSDEQKMCIDPRMKKRRNVDIKKEEIMRSCEDLAIDG